MRRASSTLPSISPFGQDCIRSPKATLSRTVIWREQRVILKHGIDLTALRRDVVHPLPADGYVSLIRGLEARKDSQDGRLAATGRPKEGQKLAVADTQINALKRASVLERFVHTPQFDDIVLSGSFFPTASVSLYGRARVPERDRHISAIHGSRSSFSADSCEKAFSGLSGRPSRTPEGCLRTFSFTHPLHEAGQRVKKSPIHDFTANLLFLKILSKHALSFFPQVPKKRLSFILVRAKKGFFTGCGSVW